MPRKGKCRYTKEWVAVKSRWGLSVDRAEKRTLIRQASSAATRASPSGRPTSPPAPAADRPEATLTAAPAATRIRTGRTGRSRRRTRIWTAATSPPSTSPSRSPAPTTTASTPTGTAGAARPDCPRRPIRRDADSRQPAIQRSTWPALRSRAPAARPWLWRPPRRVRCGSTSGCPSRESPTGRSTSMAVRNCRGTPGNCTSRRLTRSAIPSGGESCVLGRSRGCRAAGGGREHSTLGSFALSPPGRRTRRPSSASAGWRCCRRSRGRERRLAPRSRTGRARWCRRSTASRPQRCRRCR